MILYKIKLNSFPKIKFASSSCTDSYKNIITYRKNMIELSISGGAIDIIDGEMKYHCPPNSFQLIMPDMNIQTKAADSDKHYSSSVAVTGDFEFERIEVRGSDAVRQIIKDSENVIILPFYMELNNDYTYIERLFKTLIIHYLKETPAGKMRVISLWCELISWIDEEFRKRFCEKKGDTTSEYYSRKAQRYIEKHYKEKLSVKDIACMLKISPNYLSAVFRKSVGITVTEFIAKTRLHHARRLVYEGNLDYTKTAKEVGVCNEKYLNKLFKKYYGTSIQKCALTDHEISLYHDKPWDTKELIKDIYEEERMKCSICCLYW